MYKASDKEKQHVKGEESFSPTPYLDPPGNKDGRHSTGWGHQIRPNETYLMTKKLTRAEADVIFEKDAADVDTALNRQITRSLTQDQYDALFDLGYNAGTGSTAKVAATWNATGDSTMTAQHIKQFNKSKKNGQSTVNPVTFY
jgi:GH24 family phage-related lysozyme (muramidase)